MSITDWKLTEDRLCLIYEEQSQAANECLKALFPLPIYLWLQGCGQRCGRVVH